MLFPMAGLRLPTFTMSGLHGRVARHHHLAFETRLFEGNLIVAVVTTELVLDYRITKSSGHCIG
jgi:hypothetical protein